MFQGIVLFSTLAQDIKINGPNLPEGHAVFPLAVARGKFICLRSSAWVCG
jgi:hypothetical protein